MPPTPGDRLDGYELIQVLAAGGMGEVWLARDVGLGRKVALKLLPGDFSDDPRRVARFELEARAASALSHPNICHVYALGQTADGQRYIAMELVEGATLRDRLQQGSGLPLSEALRIAGQIAAAASAAHAAGIVHRDLKPENVIIRTDGLAKVLDFGLAKLSPTGDGAAASDATQTVLKTEAGAVVGTVAYMSPEQTRGQTLDARTDIWSLGVVLYEMVAGRRPFRGQASSDILAAILEHEAEALVRFTSEAPAELQRIVSKTLRKDRGQRYQTMSDLAVDLAALGDELHVKSKSGSGSTSTTTRRPVWTRRIGLAVAATVLLAAAGSWLWFHKSDGPRDDAVAPAMRVVSVTSLKGFEEVPTFSPDGTTVAFAHGEFTPDAAVGFPAGNWGVYVIAVGSAEPRRLSPDHVSDKIADTWPSWSPDGQRIAFVRHLPPPPGTEGVPGLIYMMSPFGTDVVKVSDFPVVAVGAFQTTLGWTSDSRFLVAGRQPDLSTGEGAGIYLIPLDGSQPRRLTTARPSALEFAPAVAPRGDRLAYVSCGGTLSCEIDVISLNALKEPSGSPLRVAMSTDLNTSVTWSNDGQSLIYNSQTSNNHSYLWRIDAGGQRPPERLDIAGNRARLPTVSTRGDRLAFVRSEPFDQDIYRLNPDSSSTPVVTSSEVDYSAAISPDGTLVAFESARSGERNEIWVAGIEGSNPRQVTHGPNEWQGSPSWSPDGRRLAFDSQGADKHWHIWIIDAGGGTPQQLTRGASDQNVPSWSSNGDYVYYAATADGRHHDMWRTRRDGGDAEQMTHDGSTWAGGYEVANGEYLVYRHDDARSGKAVLDLISLNGGPTRTLAKCTRDLGRPGAPEVYYADCSSERNPLLRVVDPATGHERVLGTLTDFDGAVAASPDEKTILYTRLFRRREADIMLIENFR